MMQINLPSFTEKDLQDSKERKKILDALYELSELIRRSTSNIDEHSFSPAYLAKVQKAEEQTMNDREALRQEIIAKADRVTTAYKRDIQSAEDRIGVSFIRTDTYEQGQQEIRDEFKGEIEASAKEVRLEFGNQLEDLGEITTRFEFDGDAMTINKNTSATYMQLNNESIAFLQELSTGTDTLAELSADEGLYVKQGGVSANHISAGERSSVGKFTWVDEGNLGFSLIKEQ